jgi:transcriptional regulator with XRE-family HTH domain
VDGKRLRQVRLARDLTQQALAQAADISVQYVSFLETSARRNPSQDVIDALATALQVAPRVLSQHTRSQVPAPNGRPEDMPERGRYGPHKQKI